MSDIEKLTRIKRSRDENAFKKGIREGWDQAAWLIFAVAIVIIFVTS